MKMDSKCPQIHHNCQHWQLEKENQEEAQEKAREQAQGDLHQEDNLAMKLANVRPKLQIAWFQEACQMQDLNTEEQSSDELSKLEDALCITDTTAKILWNVHCQQQETSQYLDWIKRSALLGAFVTLTKFSPTF